MDDFIKNKKEELLDLAIRHTRVLDMKEKEDSTLSRDEIVKKYLSEDDVLQFIDLLISIKEHNTLEYLLPGALFSIEEEIFIDNLICNIKLIHSEKLSYKSVLMNGANILPLLFQNEIKPQHVTLMLESFEKEFNAFSLNTHTVKDHLNYTRQFGRFLEVTIALEMAITYNFSSFNSLFSWNTQKEHKDRLKDENSLMHIYYEDRHILKSLKLDTKLYQPVIEAMKRKRDEMYNRFSSFETKIEKELAEYMQNQ